MFCAQLKRVDFAILEKNVPLYVATVTSDENFWEQILARIEFFFRRAVVPELFTYRAQRSEKLYQHGDWKNKQTNKQKTNKNGYFNSHNS